MLMYVRTFVARPIDHAARMQELSSIWRRVAEGAQSASDASLKAAKHIAGNNSGDAADAFVAASSGPKSAPQGLQELADAASRTAHAHGAAAAATSQGLAAMDSVCAAAELEFLKARLVPVIGAYWSARIVAQARTDLLRLEAATVDSLATIYAGIDLPEPLVDVSDRDQSYGTVPPDVAHAWAGLTEAERREVLQRIADEQAIANGMEPKPIVWESNANGHWDPKTSTLHINPDHVSNPEVLHTVAHETQHGLQFAMIDDYSALSQSDRDAIEQGTKADPFTQYGSNIDEVARLHENWEVTRYHGYDGKGDAASDSWRYYYYQPFEHDARRAGTEFLDDLTADKLEEYVR